MNNNVFKTLQQWRNAVYKPSPSIPDKERVKLYFENLGFTDIEVGDNLKVNATRDGNRFEGLYLGHISNGVEHEDVIITDVTFKYDTPEKEK